MIRSDLQPIREKPCTAEEYAKARTRYTFEYTSQGLGTGG